MPKDSYGIINNYIGLLLSLLRYLKTSLTLNNFLPLIYITTLLSPRWAVIASASRGSLTTLLLLTPALFTVLYKRYPLNPTTIPPIIYSGILPY
jgi:hypothetical protein